nr:histone-lysine n-methyltransferase, h3 lysine-4 specific [Quercus suber]
MSHPNGIEAIRRSDSPGSLKRKRNHLEISHTSNVTGGSALFVNGGSPRLTTPVNGESLGVKQYRSPDSDGANPSDTGDLLRGVGSTSSRASNTSSVFSHNSNNLANHRTAPLANGLTPLTSRSESSPRKPSSPSSAMFTADMASANGTLDLSHLPASKTTHESAMAHRDRPRMLAQPGKAKGYKVVWDPELDFKLGKEERKRATLRKREFGTETYEPDPPPDPRLAIPGYMSGNCRPKDRPSKAVLRIAPYNLPQYKIDKFSVGPGESQQVVVLGFDPFTPESNLRHIFSGFGTIASVQNKTDPETGSFLGIALIKYRDSLREDGMTATTAAKLAESKMNGERVGMHSLIVEVDREGRKFQRHVERALKKMRAERPHESIATIVPPPPPPGDPHGFSTDSPAPPPNAPKGPSAKSAHKINANPTAKLTPKPVPEGPAASRTIKSGAALLVEEEPILSKIKRKPYIHIPHRNVPVLGTTIPHLKKRLKAYDWREVRLDKTGYYVIFEDSKRGEDETERTFNECNQGALFTYKMAMECQKYGNPDYERTPSPERVIAEKQTRETLERLKLEQEMDFEIEKKQRAENLDPVLGALEQLRAELRDKIMSDIKTRIAIPIFHDSLEPNKHTAKRRKLGLPDPLEVENRAPTLLFNKAGDSSPYSKSRHALAHSKPLRPHDPNKQRGRRLDRDRDREPVNAFVDERRRRPPPKPSQARGLHFRLQQMFTEDEDSDDEHAASVSRDAEEQESRPLSRASRNSTPFDSESVTETTPKVKRRKVADWDDEEEEKEEKEIFDGLQKSLLGHLLHKEPEDLATRELELVINTLPRTSKYAIRAKTELYLRQRSKDDDDLFQVGEVAARSDAAVDDLKRYEEVTPSSDLDLDLKVNKEKAKKKKKTKKQILEEQEILKAEAREAELAKTAITQAVAAKVEEKELEFVAAEETEAVGVLRKLTHDKPRRTVEDDRDIVLDISGWQQLLKDDEDMIFAKKAFEAQPTAMIGDAKLWAWKQMEIKALNRGISGMLQSESGVDGYYVPNATGCARTEGYKKILNEEKSKYLPHRIKVQRAREARQAQATVNPTAVLEAAKLAAAEKIASTATSRSNRVNNRRLVNDINLQKQTLAIANSDADVAIRFNQLKKRKKLVKFDRSAIHGWGLYAEENIAVNDLIIEYVGEKVRQKVADMRELKYDRQGVGSSYLFRMMDDEIVDATKKGGIARFINHSCNPNCTAKIIKVEGTPRIVIYALKDIYKTADEELTYDYKFEREYGSTDRIPCLCGYRASRSIEALDHYLAIPTYLETYAREQKTTSSSHWITGSGRAKLARSPQAEDARDVETNRLIVNSRITFHLCLSCR